MAIKPIGENIKKPLTVVSSNIKSEVSEVMVRHGSIKEGDMTEITYFPDGRTFVFGYFRVGSGDNKIHANPTTIDIAAKVRED